MKYKLLVLAALAGLTATAASAQPVLDLSGTYRCVQNCVGPNPAYVTQNGWDLNLTNESGLPAKAWIDHPGHIWIEDWHQGAMYSPDGLTIQLDNGSVWERFVPAAPPLRSRG